MKSLLIGLLLLLAAPAWAQEPFQYKIYLDDESSMANVEIVDLNKKKIKLENKAGKSSKFKTRELLMAFNGAGQFLVFPGSPQELDNFLSPEQKDVKVDLIVTLTGQLIPAQVEKESGSNVYYHDVVSGESNKRLPGAPIAIIFYKDGDYKFFAGASRVAETLAQLSDQVWKARKASYAHVKDPETETPAKAEAAVQAGLQPATNQEASLKGSHEMDSALSGREEKAAAPSKSKTGATMDIDPEVFSQKALRKTSELGTYLGIISDRNNNMGEANKAVELAVKLFVDENAQFEVSSKEGRNRYKVRAYLNKLKLLKYDKIEISWTDISYVSNLKKGLDGNYYGVISLQQHFKGFMDNQVVYSDLTEKNIEVMVKTYQKETDGARQELWDVFLSDVGVVVTKFDQ